MTEDEGLVAAHIDALYARKLDQVMAAYDDASVVRTGNGEVRGTEKIRAHLSRALEGSPEGAIFERTVETDVEGLVVLRWRLVGRDQTVMMAGSDTFLLDGDLIREQVVLISH